MPSTVPVSEDSGLTARVRALYRPASEGLLLGPLGTYSRTRRAPLATPARAPFGRSGGHSHPHRPRRRARREEILGAHPSLAVVWARRADRAREFVGSPRGVCLDAAAVPDGVSTRRTIAWPPLAHGLPVVTTRGPLTEELWEESGRSALARPRTSRHRRVDPSLLSDESERARPRRRARTLYRERFDLSHTINACAANGRRAKWPPRHFRRAKN